MTSNQTIWIVSTNWEKVKDKKDFYKHVSVSSHHVGDDISDTVSEAIKREEQVYIFTTKKEAIALYRKIIALAQKS